MIQAQIVNTYLLFLICSIRVYLRLQKQRSYNIKNSVTFEKLLTTITKTTNSSQILEIKFNYCWWQREYCVSQAL